MNKARRERINLLKGQFVGLKTEIEILRDEEQEGYENLPDGLKIAASGEKMEAAITALDSAIDSLDEIETALDEAAL